MLIYTPVDLPNIEPDDWNKFWNIWNTHSAYLEKTRNNAKTSIANLGAKNVWIGLDIFKKLEYFKTSWQAPYYDIQQDLPKMYRFFTLLDTFGVYRIRLLQSQVNILSHTDDNLDKWHLRAYLYYTSKKEQWYFTRPHDSNGERKYISLPNTTNWFMYNDKFCWHGTDFDIENKKILLQVFAYKNLTNLLLQSINKYKEHVIRYSNDSRFK